MATDKPSIIQKTGTAIKTGAQRTGKWAGEYVEGKRDVNWKRVAVIGIVGIGVFYGAKHVIKKMQEDKSYKEALDNPAAQLAQRAKAAMGSGWVWDGTDESQLHEVFRDAKANGLKMEDVDKEFNRMYGERLASFIEREASADLYTSLTEIYKLGAQKDKEGNTMLSTSAKVQVAPGDWLVCNASGGAFIRKTPVKTSTTWNYTESAAETVTNVALWPISLIKGAFTGNYNVVDYNFSNIVGVIKNGDLAGRFTGRYALDSTSGKTVLYYEIEPYDIPFFQFLHLKAKPKSEMVSSISKLRDPEAARVLGLKFQKPVWIAASATKAYYNDATKNSAVKSLIEKYPDLDKINNKPNGKLDNFPLCYALLLKPDNFVYSYSDEQLSNADSDKGSTKIYTIGEKLNGLGSVGTNVKTIYNTRVWDKGIEVAVKSNTILGTKEAELTKGKRKIIQFRSPLNHIWYVNADTVKIV